jgi:hypothetical protein
MTPLRWMPPTDDATDTVVLPPEPAAAMPTQAACSHGYAWVLRPAGERNGRSWAAFWSGDHKTESGAWCRDRRPVQG